MPLTNRIEKGKLIITYKSSYKSQLGNKIATEETTEISLRDLLFALKNEDATYSNLDVE